MFTISQNSLYQGSLYWGLSVYYTINDVVNFLTYQFTFKNFSSEGDKYKKAKEWKVPTVSIQWLNDVFFGFNAVQCMNNPKYQNFRLEDPFRIEYTLVPNLMVSWKTPIRVTSVIIWFIFFYNIISICTYHFFQIFFFVFCKDCRINSSYSKKLFFFFITGNVSKIQGQSSCQN